MPTMKAGALKDEFSREYSFTRLTPVENGELDFMSDLDERVFKTDRMRELWEQQRVNARTQAQLLFEASEQQDPQETSPVTADGAAAGQP